MLLLAGTLAAEAQPLHTPLDRAATAADAFVSCLVEQARIAGTGRAAPRVALATARRRCRAEERALEDVYRGWQRAERRPVRGAGRAEINRLVGEAEARIIAARRGRP